MMRTYAAVVGNATRVAAVTLLAGALTGCVLAPREAKLEKRDMTATGRQFAGPLERRDLPELSSTPDVGTMVERALRANGEVENAYFEWAAAVHRIEQAGGYPNTPLSASFSYALRGGGSTLDRTGLTVGPDPMENLAFPTKVYQAAKVALDDARAARHRFVGVGFDVRRRVLVAWYEYSLQAERVRIQQENVRLLKLLLDTAGGRVRAGGTQQDLVRAETAYRIGQNELGNLEAALPQQRARLNALLARAPDETLAAPAVLPIARAFRGEDAALLALAARNNPQLATFAEQVRGRADAVELARLQYIPDFNPFLGLTGSAAQAIGIGISIPSFLPEVRGRVNEARANLSGMTAMYRQSKFDTAAGVVAAMVMLRNSERQVALYEEQIVPATERLLPLAQQAYSAGTGAFLDLVDAQRTLLDVRLGLAEARMARESTLAELEALLGAQLDASGSPDTATTQDTP